MFEKYFRDISAKLLNNKFLKIGLIIIFLGSFGIVVFSYFKGNDKNTNDKTTVQIQTNDLNDNKDSSNTNKTDEDNLDDETTVVWKGTDEELIRENRLSSKSKVSIKDRLEAKAVAEKFVKAITIVDVNNPKKSLDKALQYIGDEDEKKQLESEYTNLFGKTGIKSVVLKNVMSWEETNKENNDYVIFGVNVTFDYIDKYDQVVAGGDPWYLVKLLKLDGEYKVISCSIKN